MPTVESGDWNLAPGPTAAAVSAGSLPFGLPQVLAIMTALAAFNPDAAATMQFINTELLDELAQGTPLGEAMVNVSLLLSPPMGSGDLNLPVDAVLNQIGPMLALAPTVIGGAMTVLAAIPEAVIPVAAAVVVAVFNSAAAVGSDKFLSVVETGLYNVMNAAAKGIATIVTVVQNVLHDIAALVPGRSAARIAIAAAAEGPSTPDGIPASDKSARAGIKTNRAAAAAPARGVAGPRPRHSTSASPMASRTRSTGPTQRTAKRDAQPAGAKGTATSAR
ncbi:hypothetical protein [Mycolicibacterium sp.]|uniref:hypothetical protein n=1 Tax=Mycolicibacterium sp. TaxID=2320850 RepID=UPI0037C7F8FB